MNQTFLQHRLALVKDAVNNNSLVVFDVHVKYLRDAMVESIKVEAAAPKVGDKYIYNGFNSFTLLVCKTIIDNVVRYHFTVIDCTDPEDIGDTWNEPTEDIDDIFGSCTRERFKKVKP